MFTNELMFISVCLWTFSPFSYPYEQRAGAVSSNSNLSTDRFEVVPGLGYLVLVTSLSISWSITEASFSWLLACCCVCILSRFFISICLFMYFNFNYHNGKWNCKNHIKLLLCIKRNCQRRVVFIRKERRTVVGPTS